MPYEITYDKNIQFVKVCVYGKIDLPFVRGIASEVVCLARYNSCDRILCDLREADLELTSLDILSIPKIVTKAGLKPWSKRALVVSADIDTYSHIETASRKKGQKVSIFRSIEEAKRWLLE
jgi:hypothetical protein